MKTLFFLGALNFLFLFGIAQTNFGCYSHDVYEEMYRTDKTFRENQLQLEQETQQFLTNRATAKMPATPYIIPVVFHVIHTGFGGNISDAQIIDQIAILNKEFHREQADTAKTPDAFVPVAAPFNVEFRLATIDPSNNCTNGIDRIYSSLSSCSVYNDGVKALSYWPSNKYLNIWLVESMHYGGNTTCNGGGYATFPGGSASLDGINIRGDLIGSIGTAATNSSWGNFLGRYLIHELGHWFNLRHIWGDDNCGNDFINDTPPAETSNSGCPSFPYNSFNSCGSDINGEMFTNYMDYTNGPCLNMFTNDQVARMTAAITSPVSGRSNLWSTTNLNNTGTNNPYVYPVNCTATPDIFPYVKTVVCVGDSVKFTDMSYGGIETSRDWLFDGQPATSLTDSIVYVKYNTPGTYSVSLTTHNLSASKTKVFPNVVHVLNNLANTNYTAPFTDSFEDANQFNADWVVVNRNSDVYTWRTTTSTNFSGSQSIWINNFSNIAPAVDELISPAYDLSSASTATLNFKLHFASSTVDDNDKLQIYTSSNCGKTWNLKYSKLATSNLKTVTAYYTSNYIPPAGSSNWRQETINLTGSLSTNPVRIKFVFTSGGGNNIFIDDININTSVSTNLVELNESSGIKISPNPFTNELVIDVKESAKLDIQICDVLGKVYKEEKMVSVNNSTLKIETHALQSGMYFLKIVKDGKPVIIQKLIKQD